MRITLDIADDVLQAAQERARRENRTAGEVISDLLRQALAAPRRNVGRKRSAINGFKPFASRGAVVTNELIDELRNEGAY